MKKILSIQIYTIGGSSYFEIGQKIVNKEQSVIGINVTKQKISILLSNKETIDYFGIAQYSIRHIK